MDSFPRIIFEIENDIRRISSLSRSGLNSRRKNRSKSGRERHRRNNCLGERGMPTCFARRNSRIACVCRELRKNRILPYNPPDTP